MNAAILAIGSELLTPDRTDTNSLWITDRLNTLGVEVVVKLIAGDDRARLVEAMRYALSQAQILILTGGLGPTEDDLTRDAVAELTGRPLQFSQEICDWIAERFRRFNRTMAEVNKRQAYVLEGAEVLPNPNGTAPGQWLLHGRCPILLLPGPPREMRPMFESYGEPRLRGLLPPLVIRTRFYRVAGMGESDLDQLIAPVYTPYTNPATTILAAPGDIQVHLRAQCETVEEAEKLLAEVGDPIADLLGERIYSRGGETLEEVVGAKLRELKLRVAVAESCTGGLLGERITRVAGSSDYFAGGFLTYTYELKTRLLGIDPELLHQYKAVSEPVAQAMAEAARDRTGAEIGIAITGVAGPAQGDEPEPVGVVFIALAMPSKTLVRRVQLFGDRQRVRSMAVTSALDLLRRSLPFAISSNQAPG